MEWAAKHPRLALTISLFIICGVLAILGYHAAALLLLLFPLRVVWLSIVHPESEAAIQQDKRDNRKEELGSQFLECLATGGITVSEDEQYECVGEDPPSFCYYPMGYGVNRKRLGDIAEASLPIFGGIRSRVELLPKNDAGFYGYEITLHDKTEIDVLSNMTVEYEDIASEEPTNKAIPIGKLEDGSVVTISLDGKAGALLAGMPRTGKSVLMNSIIASLSRCGEEPGCQDGGSQRIVVCSSKTLDFIEYEQRVELYEDPEDILSVLQEINEEVERRKRYCEANRLKKVSNFTPEMPHVALLLDEFAVLKMATISDPNGKKPRRIGEECQDELFKIVSQGPFAGVFTLITSQRLSTNVISGDLRSLLAGGILISFASGDQNSDEMVFGSRCVEATACQIPVMAKGVGYVYCEGDMDEPRMFKAAMLKPEEEARIAKETKRLKPKGKQDDPKANQIMAL